MLWGGKMYINSEINKISGITFDRTKKSKNGLYCPILNAENIKLVHNYVENESSYSATSNDDFVRKYFIEHKGDTSLSSIITKVILIDTVDSTNLKRLLGKDYFKIMAQKIIDADIEKTIMQGGKFGNKFKEIASFPPKKNTKKDDMNLFVFLSKYITRVNQYCYGRDDYSIMDKVVKDNLKYFTDKENGIEIPNLEKIRLSYDFDGYCEIFSKILEKHSGVTRCMIDHFVWFTFKEEAVGDRK